MTANNVDARGRLKLEFRETTKILAVKACQVHYALDSITLAIHVSLRGVFDEAIRIHHMCRVKPTVWIASSRTPRNDNLKDYPAGDDQKIFPGSIEIGALNQLIDIRLEPIIKATDI